MIKVLSLCDGIATGFDVLKRLKINCEYHAVEISDMKQAIARDNHKGIIRPCSNLYDLLNLNIDMSYDLVLCGFTCTSLTSQGSRDGWNGDSVIFFECVRILNQVKARNPKVKFLFENVNSMKKIHKEEISTILGVENFTGYSRLTSGQDRIREYWFNWQAPDIKDQGIKANDLLDPDGLHLFSFSKSNRNPKGSEIKTVEGRIKASTKSGTLLTGLGCNGQSTMNKVITKKMQIRDLTVRECARLQSIGNYVFNCDDKVAFNAIGNGWEANIIKEIMRGFNV